MAELRVGRPYNERLSSWTEGVHVLGLSAQRLEVVVALNAPGPDEVQAFRSAPLEVGLATHGELVVLLLRIQGVLDWSDAPYDLRLLPPEEQGLPPIAGLAPLWLLVDGLTGVVRAIRMASLTPTFVTELRARLELQARRPFNRGAYDRAVEEYQRRFSSAALVGRAWVVETAGLSEQPDAALTEVRTELSELLSGLIDDDRVREVVAEAVARGDAYFEEREGEWWYVDVGFGDDVPLRSLGYDESYGLVDRRSHPEPGQA